MRAVITPILCTLAVMSTVAMPLPTQSATARSVIPLPNAVPFRETVARLYNQLHPLCTLTLARSNESIMAPAQAVVDDFRQEISGTAYASLFDAAVRDAAQRQASIRLECGHPGETPIDTIQQRAMRDAQAGITHLRTLMAARR